ncbi:MAG TPA: malonyl-ACP O-methyltransferase BioC [Usitatibacter sp.]|jgi:malonyl-CoA O-methyltransferase|nr:malonyl-ACP O-methyltransferase BioC [Usitatibacter sp.]
MTEAHLPDKRAVRRAFSRAAGTYDEHAVLQREVGQRLVEHLEGIRIEPARILDLGCGTGASFGALAARYPRARLRGLDLARPMLAQARQRVPAWRRMLRLAPAAPSLVCADAERLPFAAASHDLVFSNLTLQWCDPARVFAEVARIVPAGGLFMFSTLGPDTLKELRAAFAAADGADHVNAFVDMHDLGDALVQAGFADPVMEMEVLTLEYASVERVVEDLRSIGATNALPGRPRGLGGRARWQRVEAAYERARRDGILPATYEVVYGHAWKAQPRAAADGRAILQFHPRGRP